MYIIQFPDKIKVKLNLTVMAVESADTAPLICPPGTAPIKTEYSFSQVCDDINRFLIFFRFLISYTTQNLPDDDAAEGSTTQVSRQSHRQYGYSPSTGPQRKHMSKEEKKATRGANKGRRFGKVRDEVDLCWKIANESICEYGEWVLSLHPLPVFLLGSMCWWGGGKMIFLIFLCFV